MPVFKKDPLAAIYKAKKREVKSEIKKIKRLADPAERLQQLKALDKDLHQNGFDTRNTWLSVRHNPYTLAKKWTYEMSGILGGTVGLAVACIASTLLAVLTGSALVTLASIGFLAVAGVAGGIALNHAFNADAKYMRKTYRKQHGTLRNARRMYHVQNKLEGQVAKNERLLNPVSLIEKFSQFAKKCTGNSTAPAPSSKGGKYGIMLLP